MSAGGSVAVAAAEAATAGIIGPSGLDGGSAAVSEASTGGGVTVVASEGMSVRSWPVGSEGVAFAVDGFPRGDADFRLGTSAGAFPARTGNFESVPVSVSAGGCVRGAAGAVPEAVLTCVGVGAASPAPPVGFSRCGCAPAPAFAGSVGTGSFEADAVPAFGFVAVGALAGALGIRESAPARPPAAATGFGVGFAGASPAEGLPARGRGLGGIISLARGTA